MTTVHMDTEVYEAYLARGLCRGEIHRGQACIVAAVNAACGGPVSDIAEAACVSPALRAYAIRINDSSLWTSDESRAAGLRRLGYLLPGTRHLDGAKFATKLAELTIRRVLPPVLRLIGLRAEADRCEATGAYADAYAAAAAAAANYASAAAAAANYAAAHDATDAEGWILESVSYAVDAAAATDAEERLLVSVECAIEAIAYAFGAA